MVTEAYDPLDYDNLAHSIVHALLERDPVALPPTESFPGCGVYALYYTGSLKFYSHVSSMDFSSPIYVGKAVPRGARKGSEKSDSEAGNPLYSRLRQHANSIKDANNLLQVEFKCRYLVLVPVWITLAERFLIDHFNPVWNTVIDGFGNHNPGKGRSNMRRPHWDILHPGRPWAESLTAAETADQIIALIE